MRLQPLQNIQHGHIGREGLTIGPCEHDKLLLDTCNPSLVVVASRNQPFGAGYNVNDGFCAVVACASSVGALNKPGRFGDYELTLAQFGVAPRVTPAGSHYTVTLPAWNCEVCDRQARFFCLICGIAICGCCWQEGVRCMCNMEDACMCSVFERRGHHCAVLVDCRPSWERARYRHGH